MNANAPRPPYALLRRLRRDRRGNVLMLLGFAMVPVTFAAGMAIDYGRAMRTQTRLNAAADAAALAAVNQQMMSQSSVAACSAARNMFTGQSTGLDNLVFNANSQLSISVTDSASSTSSTTSNCSGSSSATTASYSRTATVAYTATVKTSFAGILGISTIPISGSSTATAAVAPNIDFYIMIDTSPSMLLPATSAGLSSMTTATGGCAFACHQTSTTQSDPGNTSKVAGKWLDYYQVARNLNITLRTDLVHTAVQDLTTLASTTAQNNKAVYRMGISDFDYMFRQIWPTTANNGYYVDSSLTNVSNHATDATVLVYCRNNQRVCGVGDNDTGTNFTAAFNGVLNVMPTKPGNGTTANGDTPQAMLFIITDGMRDENYNGSRKMGPLPTALCDTVKNRGIRIAILNTQYLPESASDSWSIANVKTPYLSPTDNITPALSACASPGLFYQVTTDGNISAALGLLFQKAVSTARLTQ